MIFLYLFQFRTLPDTCPEIGLKEFTVQTKEEIEEGVDQGDRGQTNEKIFFQKCLKQVKPTPNSAKLTSVLLCDEHKWRYGVNKGENGLFEVKKCNFMVPGPTFLVDGSK